MPLDNVARRYADQLFQESLESILKSQGLELANVTRDYAARNMTLSEDILQHRLRPSSAARLLEIFAAPGVPKRILLQRIPEA